MPFKIRSSKYRHVYGNPHKEEVCYKNIKITKNAASDSSFCASNPKFVAVVTEECGGGAFLVIPIKQTGRIEINMPKITGHRGPVLDLKWNPFNDNEIASCSEDTTIKVWQVPDMGLTENLNEWVVDLHGHQRKVNQIEWHPTTENVMISAGADFQVILWNLEKAEPIRIISCHNDTIHSMCWNRNGSLFATCCKDRKIRIIDPRTGAVVVKGDGHQGSKISRVVMLSCGTKLFTTGFSKLSERQIALWNINDLSKPIQMEFVDCSSGVLIPYYDSDTNIIFVAGKGDGNIRYYEITDSEPYIHYLSEYKSSSPQRGLGFMPKRGLDVTKNEIFRFYKLHATGGICEPISMIVPRKSEVFQEDIYPDTPSGIPSLSCNEWLNGETKDPILMSMKDGAIPFMPKIVTYKHIGFSDLSNNNYSRSHMNSSKKSDNESNNKENPNENDLSAKLFIENSTWKTNDNKSSKSHGIEMNNRKLNNNHFSKSSSSSSDSSSPAPSSSPHKYDDGLNNDEMLDSIDHHHLSMNKQNDELEGSYLTSVSRNPVTLRKTESLKLDSVQSLRNRFNRISSSNIGTLVRNRTNSINQNDSQINNSNLIESNTYNENEPPPPPTFVHSPSYGVNKPAVPTPLLATAINSENSTSNLLNGGCVKKRVWTPVQSTSSLKDANNLCTNTAEVSFFFY
jgi:coronin-2